MADGTAHYAENVGDTQHYFYLSIYSSIFAYILFSYVIVITIVIIVYIYFFIIANDTQNLSF